VSAIKLKFEKAKEFFFDRNLVKELVDKQNAQYLSIVGYRVRREARKSIRQARPGEKPAKPNKPPKSRVGTLKALIVFVFDRKTRSVVIGPALANRAELNPTVPELLEYGGEVTRVVPRKRRREGRVVYVDVAVRMNYKPHPYMRPALAKIEPQMPKVWQEVSAKIKN
jgi:hypothetical protein